MIFEMFSKEATHKYPFLSLLLWLVIAGLVGRFWWTVIHRFSSQQFASKEEMMEFVKIHHCKETTQAAMAPGDTVYECDAGFSVIVQNNH